MKHRYLTIWLTYCNFMVLHFFFLCSAFISIRIYIHWLWVLDWAHVSTLTCNVQFTLRLFRRLWVFEKFSFLPSAWPRAVFCVIWAKGVCRSFLSFSFWGVRSPFQFALSSWNCRIDYGVRYIFTCNRTGHWQPGSLAGVAHLLERNTDVPRTAPWGQKPLLEFKGKSCLNLCTLSTSTQCLKYVISFWEWSLCVKARPSDPLARMNSMEVLHRLYCSLFAVCIPRLRHEEFIFFNFFFKLPAGRSWFICGLVWKFFFSFILHCDMCDLFLQAFSLCLRLEVSEKLPQG